MRNQSKASALICREALAIGIAPVGFETGDIRVIDRVKKAAVVGGEEGVGGAGRQRMDRLDQQIAQHVGARQCARLQRVMCESSIDCG